jgi:antitoxin HicB
MPPRRSNRVAHNRTFSVILEPQPQPEGGFTVLVPALPEIVTEGDTEEEALAMAEDAIRLVLEDRAARGESIPTDSSTRIREVKVDMCRWPLIPLTFFIFFIVGAMLISYVPPGYAQAGYPSNEQDPPFDSYVWFKDLLSDREIASSRRDAVLNYLEVGDLLLADVSKMKVDTELKTFSLIVIHDTRAFERLKNDKNSFSVLGLTDAMLLELEKQTKDGLKCQSVSFVDRNHDIISTLIMISEKYHDCLFQGIFQSFGVKLTDNRLRTLVNLCVLYEARRLGIRERQELHREGARIALDCLNK